MSAATVVAIVALLLVFGVALAVLSPSTLAEMGVASSLVATGSGPGAQLLLVTSVILAALFAVGVARRVG